MAIRATKDPSELGSYLEQLRALPFIKRASFHLAKGPATPLRLELVAGSAKYRFEVTVLRTHLSRVEAERWIGKAARVRGADPLLLFAPYVSRPMGERLREAGVQYVDELGNVFLQSAGARKGEALVALVEGKRPAAPNRAEAPWRGPSYQVLLALLIEPELLSASVRKVAAAASVSTTPVLQVKGRLVHDGFAVSKRERWQWTPDGLKRARDFWLYGYHTTLRSHLMIGRFRPRVATTTEALEKQVADVLGERFSMRWGGASAAHRLDGYYRGDRTVVHLDDQSVTAASLAASLRMLPDPEGPLVIQRLAAPCALHSPNPHTVHPLLVWAELLEEGHDRASEAAERIERIFLEVDNAQR